MCFICPRLRGQMCLLTWRYPINHYKLHSGYAYNCHKLIKVEKIPPPTWHLYNPYMNTQICNFNNNNKKETDANDVENAWTYITVRAFPIACVKFKPNFDLKSYFFYFTQSLFKTPFIRFSIFNSILFKYYFFINFLLLEKAIDGKKEREKGKRWDGK